MAIKTSGLTVQELSEQLGVHHTTVGRWINEETVPRRGMLLQVALMTNVPAEWLISGKEPEEDLEVLEAEAEVETAPGRSDNPEVTYYEAA